MCGVKRQKITTEKGYVDRMSSYGCNCWMDDPDMIEYREKNPFDQERWRRDCRKDIAEAWNRRALRELNRGRMIWKECTSPGISITTPHHRETGRHDTTHGAKSPKTMKK